MARPSANNDPIFFPRFLEPGSAEDPVSGCIHLYVEPWGLASDTPPPRITIAFADSINSTGTGGNLPSIILRTQLVNTGLTITTPWRRKALQARVFSVPARAVFEK